MQVKIEYSDNQFIELMLDDFVLLTGGNHRLLRQVYQSLRLFNGKISGLENNIYGENGIQLEVDGKELKSKDLTILAIENQASLVQNLTLNKGTILFDLLKDLKNDIEVTRLIEQVNDQLLQLESVLQRKLGNQNELIQYHLLPIQFEDLIKNNIRIGYFYNDLEVPIAYVDTEDILEIYLAHLAKYIEITGKPIWLVLNQPETFLSAEFIEQFIQRISILSQETRLVHLIVITHHVIWEVNQGYLPRTVVCYDDILQMPILGDYRTSLQNHYPDEFRYSDEKLIKATFRLIHLIGLPIKQALLISPKDMVLFVVMKELFEDYSDFETSIEELSEIEYNFLIKKGILG
ncbi:CRISPR-associated protein Csn2-St [Vaginisenegalia massiliensis]|uniref:CRISPR-associated protein Csn2-St n=1 Tax=Vaginisenegalia massiliensis TaxID=2058294 RepID=UPI000F534919|nr:CRISPR-associated protein Csn2-St [Vaginisenegalia massiliensis]